VPFEFFLVKMPNKGNLWENLWMSIHSKPRRARKPQETNRIAIIGGSLRHRLINFPDAEGLRPTASRVRETLFNWLGQTLHERKCLDLFSGSGALGFEAASRGADTVVMVEPNKRAFRALQENKELLKVVVCELHFTDAVTFLTKNKTKFDVVFLDPPFSSEWLAKALDLVVPHVADAGVVYFEGKFPLNTAIGPAKIESWQVLKESKAGVVHFGLISPKSSAKGFL
jgi:16S rRNA (guanine(966)-N(2))-methyltransferase RsmD